MSAQSRQGGVETGIGHSVYAHIPVAAGIGDYPLNGVVGIRHLIGLSIPYRPDVHEVPFGHIRTAYVLFHHDVSVTEERCSAFRKVAYSPAAIMAGRVRGPEQHHRPWLIGMRFIYSGIEFHSVAHRHHHLALGIGIRILVADIAQHLDSGYGAPAGTILCKGAPGQRCLLSVFQAELSVRTEPGSARMRQAAAVQEEQKGVSVKQFRQAILDCGYMQQHGLALPWRPSAHKDAVFHPALRVDFDRIAAQTGSDVGESSGAFLLLQERTDVAYHSLAR